MAGGQALNLTQEIYKKAYDWLEDLCRPYAAVINIDRALLPEPKTVRRWSGSEYAAALRHDQKCRAYNLHFRQLLHVGFKVATEMGPVYLQALEANGGVIGCLVTENLLEMHIKPVFIQP